MTQVFYAWLDGDNKIVGAGMSPDRDTYDFLIAQRTMPDAELIETETNLTYSINHTYDRDTGELTPPDPPARPALFAASPAPAPTTMEDLIIALDEKENGDPSKWNELLAQARNNTNGQPS